MVEIVQIEEIGLSALSLQKTLESRLERAAAGETEEGDPLEEDGIGEVGGRIPKYKRSMLKLHLSDGHILIPAIEYRPLPELELGITTLGYKVGMISLLRTFAITKSLSLQAATQGCHCARGDGVS